MPALSFTHQTWRTGLQIDYSLIQAHWGYTTPFRQFCSCLSCHSAWQAYYVQAYIMHSLLSPPYMVYAKWLAHEECMPLKVPLGLGSLQHKLVDERQQDKT